MIAGFGFGGYTPPREEWSFKNGMFTQLSNGLYPPFLKNGVVPITGTEGVFTGSVIGCTCALLLQLQNPGSKP